MAKKYWWEEDENQSTTQNQTKTQKQHTQQAQSQTEKKYWWDEVDSKSERQGHWWDSNNLANDIGNSVSDRVNSWLQNYNSYISDYQKRYEGRKGSYEDSYVSDSSDWLNTVGQKKSNFDAEASAIIDYMSQYEDYLDASMVAKVRNLLTEGKGTVKNIYDSAAKDNEFWSSFGNEELVKKFGSAEEAYKYYQRADGYSKKYEGATGDEIQKALDTIGVGEEKDWLRVKRADIFGDTIRGDEAFQDYVNIGSSLSYTDFGTETRHRGKSRRQKSTTSIDNYRAASLALAEHYGNEAPLGLYDKYEGQVAIFRTMDDKEFENLAYCIAYDKENGTNTAEQYVDFIEEELSSRRGTDIGKTITGIDIPIIEDLAVLGYGAMAGVDSFAFGLEQRLSDKEVAYYPSHYANEHISDSLDGIGYYAHQAATSIGNMAPSILVSSVLSGLGVPGKVAEAAGSATMGISASGNAYKDALMKGYDQASARTYGDLVGASEGALQYLIGGIGTLGGVSGKITGSTAKIAGKVAAIDNSLLRVAAKLGLKGLNLGLNIGSEIIEEELQNYLEPAFRTIIFGEEYDAPTMDELIETAIVTALSTGVLEGGRTSTEVNNEIALNQEAVKEYGGKAETLVQEGLGLEANSKANLLAQEYQKKTDSGKNLTGYEIRELLAANQEQITTEDIQKIQKAAEQRLIDLGQTEDVQKLAELATKYATGQKMSKAEKSFLANSKNGSQVASTALPENIRSGGYNSAWVENVGTRLLHRDVYDKEAYTKEVLDKWRASMDEYAKMNDPATYKSLDKRVDEKDKLTVSKTGKATIRKSGVEIDLSKAEVTNFITDKESGKIKDMTLNVDGKEVKASEIDYADDSQSYLFSAVQKIENITPGDAQVIIRDYDPSSGMSVSEYLNGMDEAYTYGYHNYSVEDMKAGNFTTKLSDQQMMGAYEMGKYTRSAEKTAKTEAIKRMRTAVEAEVENAREEGKEAPKAKQMTITYNAGSGKVVDFDKAGLKLTDKQKSAPALAKVFHEMGLGTNFELFASYVNKDGVRVYLDENGVEQKAPSGVYRMKDGTVRIDLNAYNGRGLTMDVMAHELTHFIQQWSDTKYQALADFLVQTYEKTDMTMHERVLREQARLKNTRGEDVSYNEAYDEVVANAMSKMLADGKVMERLNELKAQDADLAQKLWAGLKKFLNKFFRIAEKQSALFHDANDLMQLKAEFQQMQQMWAEAFVEASENFQTSLTAAESQTLTEAGIGFDESTQSVYSLHFSNAYTEQIQVGKKSFDAEAIAQLVSKVTNRSITDARKWVQSEMAIANIVMQNPEFLDFEADNRYEAIKKNSDYPQGTVDLSNLCPKREEFTTMFDMLQKKYPNKLFTAQDVADMRKILSDNDITVACGACFVEDRRQLIGEIADTFIGMWKEAVDSGKPLQKTNAAGSKVELQVTKALAKQYGLTAGTKIMATDTYIPNQYDLTTYEGFKKLEKNHPTIAMAFNRYNNSRGQQSARLIEGRAEYKRQILGWSDAKVKSVNNNGGLRIFSFSDFEVVHLLDLAQVIIDCAAKGVKIQGYTKIPAFAKLVRDTGIKLNRSLIPKGDYGYHMENGKVVLDYDTTEGINIKDKNFMDESDNPNVGNIVIGINPTQIGAAMLDPFIDYIIPFHSNKAKEILRKLGTGEWVNYKESQHEKDIATGTSSKHNVNIYTEVINKYHPTNKVEFVEAFLKECKRQGKIPRYAEFLNVDANGDYAYREGYHKLLVDFKMFDAEGNILPQGNITPNLDEAFMKDLLNAEIDKKQNYEFPQKVYDDIDKKFGERYSSQETDADSISVNDIVTMGNGKLAVSIDSKASGLHGHRKGEWPALVSGMIRKTLSGKSIIAADGDIITVTRRGANEVGFGTDTKKLRAEAKASNDYSKVEQKMITAEHAASIIALSRYSSWSKNIEDPTDMFKRDGLNYRTVEMFIDGDPYTATVVTALNADPKQPADYGDKFYDIESIEKQTNLPASYGTPNVGAVPHKIKMADSSSDRLTIAQKQRIVNRQNAAYSTGDSGTKTAMAEAFGRAKELKSSQETDADNAPIFYSKMGKVIEGMKQEKFGASSVISMLRDPKRGVKAEEIRWSGIQAFLDGKKSVTKAELLDFIKGSMLQIEEETRSKNDTRTEFIQAWRNFVDPDLDESEILAGLDSLDEMESYLESLVEDDALDRYYADYILDLANKVDNKDLPAKWHQYKLDGGYNYRELLFKMPGSDYSNVAMHTHWGSDETGVLAHARIQDMDTFIGKMLFIEEIQSDWHNEGHKEGYRNEGEKTDRMLRQESKKAYEDFYAAVEKMVYDNANWEDDNAVYYVHPVVVAEMFEGNESYFEQYGFTDEQRETIRSMVAEETARQEAMKTAPKDAAVPDAPFKKNYHEYVLKRLIRMAAEEGYDSIGWTTAETQDERWQNTMPHKEGTGKSGFLKAYTIEYDQNIKNFLEKFGKQWGTTVGKTALDNGTEVWSMAITDSMQESVLKEGQELYSGHETDNIDNRSLLANAFEGITKDSKEYELIQEYKGRIKILNEYEEKLAKLNAEIRKMLFDPNTERDAKKIKELQDEAKKVAENINRNDKKLLSLEASEPLRKVIDRERKKEAKKTKDHVKELIQNKKERAEQTELRHKIRKTIRDLDKILNRGNKQRNVKEDMKGFVSKALELADYLFTDHISNDELIRNGIDADLVTASGKAQLVKETEDILTKLYDEADSLTDEEFTRLDAKRKANEAKMKDLLTAQRNRRLDVPVYNLFNDLVTEYASLKNSNQDAVKAAYNDEVERLLRTFTGDVDSDRAKALKNMRVADMTTEELWKLYNAYTMVLTTVRDANKFHVQGMNQTIEQVVGQIAGDFSSRKIPEKKLAIAAQKLANKIGWDYEKLYYALDRIGSEAFTELIMNLADSENIVMRDIMEAMDFRDQIVEKYGFNDWAVNKEIDREFLDNTGKKFKMTLGQMMSLYAYSRREGAWDHIEYGGFVFGEAALTNPKPADSYKLSKEQCEAITSLLTKEQKGYVEDMQKFLSETMGEKGNEVSMQLYGIKMFGEKNYFPIHIAGQFKAQANESQAKAAAGFQSMSNAGFTHAQNPNAKAPFVLEGFNEIWSDHVNEMSRYHGTVPALEDLRRVMNRSTYSDSVAESQSIKQLMENHYGKEAVDYFDNLYREANSGAITDKLQKWPKKLLSLFRKNSVAYSLSVLVQQPASVVRAYAVIDRKYFGFKGFGTITSGVAKAVSSKWNPAYANAYNEMLKYAPGVTMAKEIGGFDTATGGSIRSTLLDTGKSIKQKWNTGTALEKGKAVLDAVDNNAIANLPNVADKIAWIEIWNACKRETVAKHKDLATNSEEFMQIVGERFTEVIRATQVYDSIFAKSPMLKSKNLVVQYLVSFMNEPNTVANMAEKAVRDATRGNWKQGMLTGTVVIHSIIFTNMLKSIIYALRDDDEDETYIEKYIEAVTGNMMDDINPFNYIPIARDVVSIAQGYDVERADMAIVADALDALDQVLKNAAKDTEDMTEEELIEFDKKVTEANWKLVESLAAFLGIPVKNVRREINAVIDHARIASANAGQSTANSVWDTISEAVIDSIPFMSTKETKTDKLYDAIVSGDEDYLGRLKGTYKTDSAYETAVRKALRENDSRIHDAAQARYEGNTEEYKRIFREIQKEGKFTFDEIMDAINSEENAIKNKLEPDKVTSSYSASDFVQAVSMGDTNTASAAMDDIINTHVANGRTQAEAEAAFVSSVKTSTHEAYSSGLLDEAGAKNMLMEYADMDEEEAASKVSYWSFLDAHPEYEQYKLTEANVRKYHEFAEPTGISMEVFVQFRDRTKGLANIKDEWGDVEKSVRDQTIEVIHSLPLTWQQKDALYLAAELAESRIWDVPW